MSRNDRPASIKPGLVERLAAGLDAQGLPTLDAANQRSPAAPTLTPTPTPTPGPTPTPIPTPLSAPAFGPVHPSAAPRTSLAPHRLSHELLEENGMVSLRRRSRVGEEFRIVRHHVLEHLKQPPADNDPARHHNVVLVTSARDGEGKSFAALNLAGLLAEGGTQDVVLVDADIGHASLTAHFNLADVPGLLEFGQSPRQLARTVPVGTALDRLIFIPVGGTADAQTRGKLAAEQPIRHLIAQVANSYDNAIIVIDAPACLTKSDPTEISAIAGQVILVVESGQTRRADIEQSLDLLDSCPQLSLLLNRAPVRRRGLFAARA
ncbi:protein-tyrosine kinase [Acidiphilium sp. MT5]